jgi:hypothetical protein
VDIRRGKKGRVIVPPVAQSVPQPAAQPAGAADFAAVLAKLDAVIDGQHELRRLVHRMTVVVDVLSSPVAAKRLGVSVRTLERITARGIFTDARAPERRVPGADRVYFADEVQVYITDGERGVERLRKELGRA